MNTPSPIPLYKEINDCHEAAGFPLRTDLPEFHVFNPDETYPRSRQAMPPFRRGFYQLSILEAQGEDATIHLDETALAGTENVLVISPPEQVLSWVYGGTDRGFMLYFKPELLGRLDGSLEETFPFFDPFAMNVLSLNEAERNMLRSQLEHLRDAFHSGHAYRRPRLAALTTARCTTAG